VTNTSNTSSPLEGYHLHLMQCVPAGAKAAGLLWLQTVTNDFDWSWIVNQFRLFLIVPPTTLHNNFQLYETLHLLGEYVCPSEKLVPGWKPVRETNRPVVRRGMYYFMSALGGEPGARDWSKGTTGVLPVVSPTASYKEYFESWKGTTLQAVQDDPSIVKAIVEAAPLSRASNIAVINGVALDRKAAAEFIEGKKKYQLAYETLKVPTVGNKDFFALQRDLASKTVPQHEPQPFPLGGLPDELSGVLPPPTATIAIGSVMVSSNPLPPPRAAEALPEALLEEETQEVKRKRIQREKKKRSREKQSDGAKIKDKEKAQKRMANKRSKDKEG
jgi:hypothetical protein